ncbi:hypothetical protein J6590_084413 [Homalodisca vitripennis]|nr:hypothetical protein J6590_084413 [Homalodisca vitripennis]
MSPANLSDSDIIDDSDKDPTFDPEQPSTSGIQDLPLPLPRPRLSVLNDDLLSSSDEEDNATAFTTPQVPPPRMYRRGLGLEEGELLVVVVFHLGLTKMTAQ